MYFPVVKSNKNDMRQSRDASTRAKKGEFQAKDENNATNE
jgi:hypothetical protein